MTDPSQTQRLDAAFADRYRIGRRLGEGGMATVFLAEDLKHQRQVAIKVLKPELAAMIGGERFVSEIRTTANLQHPHILALFDSGEADGFLYYVMPYVEGETLRGWIDREKQLSVEDAVRVTKAVANALQYAHDHDVIHRDIKPENILLHAGEPVVADFGIALAISAAGGGRMTETGLSLGTPHYMSPEQATADRDLSPRSDVYSLACVLYEMLAGAPPHAAPTAQGVLMKILTEDAVPITKLRRSVPTHIESALARGLEKLPADRFESADAFRRALDETGYRYAPTTLVAAPIMAEAASPTRGLSTWIAAVIAVAAIALGYVMGTARAPEPVPTPPVEFQLLAGDNPIIAPCCGRAVAISPQGDRIVYQAETTDFGMALFQRPLGQRSGQEIPGTTGGRHPFFSPDGQWLGFFVNGNLKKTRFDGGTPQTITNESGGTLGGAAWAPDNTIVYGVRFGRGLYRVSADGGDVRQITTIDTTASEVGHRWPHILPDGKTVIFGVAVRTQGSGLEEFIATVPLEGGEHERLFSGADPRYVDSGHIVFSDQAGGVVAQPFDMGSLTLSGERFRIAERTSWRGAPAGITEYDISRTGSIVYREGGSDGTDVSLMLVTEDGTAEILLSAPGVTSPRFSPDGRYLAYEVKNDEDEIWVWDLLRSNPTRVTFDDDTSFPAWSPDSERVFFGMRDARAIGSRRRDGAGETKIVVEGVRNPAPPHISPDGEWIVWLQSSVETESDIWIRRLDGSEEPRLFLGTPIDEMAPAISPNGRWIAYVSENTGDDEVYVEPFPEGGPRFKVSVGGARGPAWSADGRRLFYRAYGGRTMLTYVDVRPGDQGFDVGPPIELFPVGEFDRISGLRAYDVHPDGKRFAFVGTDGGGDPTARIVVATNAVMRRITGR